MREVDKRAARCTAASSCAAPPPRRPPRRSPPPALTIAPGRRLGDRPAQTLKPATMTVLARAARDIYPHDRLADRYYIAAVLPYDDKAAGDAALKALLEDGVGAAGCRGEASASAATTSASAPRSSACRCCRPWRSRAFFQKLRGDLVVSLYNQKEVWPKLGYEGSSYEHGGYLHRGFNDIDWLPEA